MEDSAVIVEAIYPAPLSKVWQAITDKEQMKEWYFTIEDFVLKEGAVFNFSVSEGEKLYRHRCVITEVVPNKRFQHTWTHPDQSKGESIVTWSLELVRDDAKVTLTHEGIETFSDGGPDFKRENYLAGWTEILKTELRQFLEK